MKQIKLLTVHILAVLMVLSGIGTFGALEANAESSYERLIPKETTVLSTVEVTFNGYKWYIIKDNSESDGTLTLLAADTSFGVAKGKYEDGNRYADDVLSGLTEPGGDFAGVADAVKEIRFLSVEEAGNLPAKVRKMDFSADGESDAGWWLQNTNSTERDIVKNDGELSYQSKDKKYGVRPVLVLDLSQIYDPGWREFIFRYPLWVGKTRVTSQEGKSSGDGWSYDAVSNTLTLSDYTDTDKKYYEDKHLKTYGIYYSGDRDLTINTEGDCTIGSSERKPVFGIASENNNTNITFKGSGALSLTARENAVTSGGGVEIAGGKITAASKEYSSIIAENDIKISGGTVTAITDDFAAIFSSGDGSVVISDGTVAASSQGGEAIFSYEDIKISGGTVTASSTEADAIASSDGSVVISGGEVNASSQDGEAIYSIKDVKISGGTVTAASEEDMAIASGSEGGIVISGGTVTATAKSDAIFSSKDVEITGGVVKADSSKDSGISAVNVIIGTDAKLTATGYADAIYGTVKNSIAGTGWTDIAGTGEGARIYKNTDGQDLDDLDYKKVEFPRLQYDVIIDKTGEGTVTADPSEGDEGDKVTLTVKPDDGYWLKSLKATSAPKDGEPTTGLSLDDIYDLLHEQPLYLNGDKDNAYLKADNDNFYISYNQLSKGAAYFAEKGNGNYEVRGSYNPFTMTFTVQGGELRKAEVTTSSSASSDQRRAGTYTPVYPEVELAEGENNTYTFELPAADVYVDAVFDVGSEEDVCTVTFELNGGTMTDPVVRLQKGEKVERPAVNPSKAGKYFDDWYVDDIHTEVFDFDNTTIEGDTTIYAGWANGIVAVAWDQKKNEPDRDGKYGTVRVGEEGSYRYSSGALVVDGDDFTLYAKASSGYRFAGWVTSSDESDPTTPGDTVFSKDNPYKGKNSGNYIIYYAMFEEATPYELSVTPYDRSNSKENAGGKIKIGTDAEYSGKASTETVYNGETVTISAETADGYEFLGWATSKDSETYVSTDAEYSFDVVGDASYYAVFKTHEHSLTHVEAKAATCAAEGNTEYWVCDQGDHPCGKYFSDENATAETTKEAVTKAVDPDAHDWAEPVYEFSSDYSSCTATRTCRNDASHQETETVDVTSQTKASTCAETGLVTYESDVFKNTAFQKQAGSVELDIDPNAHDWGDWVTTTEATEEAAGEQTRICKNDPDHKETRVIPPLEHNCAEGGWLVYKEEVAAGCTSQGMKAHYECSKCGAWYTDKNGTTLTSEGECRIPATGHKAGTPEKGEETAATCSSVGGYNLTTKCENCGSVLNVQRVVFPIDSVAHDWDAPTYEWSDDYSTCTAKRVCKLDSDHTEEETVDSTSVTKDATEEEAGSTTYTAEFTNEAFETQSVSEEIPKLPKTINTIDIVVDAPVCGTTITWSKPDGGVPDVAPEITVTTDVGYITSSKPVWQKDGSNFEGTIKGDDTYSAYLILMIPYEDQSSYRFAKDVKVTVNGKEITPKIVIDVAMIATADVTAEHDWGDWKVTREATTSAEGQKERVCKGCGEVETKSIPKLDPTPTPTPTPSDSGETKSTVKPVLVAKGIASGKKAVKISWNKVSGADRYVVYMTKCNQNGKSYSFKKVKTVSTKVLKFKKTKLAKKTAYKFYVVAQKKVNGKYKNIAKSKMGHFITGNVRGKYTNPKNLKLNKTAVSLSVGKTAKIKGTVTKVKKGKKLATTHAKKLRFKSNNTAVATVSASGKITAKSKGTAKIYVQTINGIWKTVKVTVK